MSSSARSPAARSAGKCASLVDNPHACDCRDRAELSDSAHALWRAAASTGQFIADLVRDGLYEDATTYLAHDLPPCHAVWWACLAIWSRHREAPDELLTRSLKAVIPWVQEPSEAHRCEALRLTQRLDRTTSAFALAAAVASSGGSMTEPPLPPVPPPPGLTGRFAGCVVRLAADGDEARYRQFLQFAAEIRATSTPWSLPRQPS
ncbi:MAG: hypothetical protein KDA61_07075 [Planctomycetales bacterium]|nr:hypothetical protein [Planctomycetales bacterium]